MVTLPKLEDYSAEDLDYFESLSPIYAHYRNIIDKPFNDFSDQLRQEKHKYWLRCAFATLMDTHSPEEVCSFWSIQAENIITKSWNHFFSKDQDISLFAFGKLGSQELNLSSDIDVVFVKDLNSEKDLLTPTKNFIKSLSEVRSSGFAFRVDTNLRPGGPASPLLPTQTNFFNFYDSYIEAWHRISFVRMRPLLGSKQLNESIMNYCQRVSFPRRLDYSILQEIKGIRSKLQSQWKRANEPLDVKFYPGGIRDIELYIQSLQVIYGGHKLDLKTSSISKAMTLLHKENVLSDDNYSFLSSFYWFLRKIENHIHGVNDQHTYKLTKDIFKSFKNPIKEDELISSLDKSNKIISDFFTNETIDSKTKVINMDSFSEESQSAINDIKSLKSYSLKKSSVEQQKTELLSKYANTVENIAIDKNLAIQTFRDFIFSIKSKSSIFYLLNRHEALLENIAWLFSLSPYIGRLLCLRPELVDSFALGKVDLQDNLPLDDLLESLIDYKLLGQIISISYLLKNQNILNFCDNLSEHADLIASSLLKRLCKEFNSSPLDILCLGKWGGKELGIKSDLDFIFLCDTSPGEKEFKVARRFINYMTTPSRAGKLYSIDLRLKPNESAGPLLVQYKDLQHFISNKAQPWQKQAYLRSRLLSQKFHFLKENFQELKITEDELLDLKSIHQKLIIPSSSSKIDLKYSPGGLVETEFSVQLAVMRQNSLPKETNTLSFLETLQLSQDTHTTIQNNYSFIRRFEQIFQICTESSSTKVPSNHPVLTRIGKVLKLSDPFKELEKTLIAQKNLLKSLDASI